MNYLLEKKKRFLASRPETFPMPIIEPIREEPSIKRSHLNRTLRFIYVFFFLRKSQKYPPFSFGFSFVCFLKKRSNVDAMFKCVVKIQTFISLNEMHRRFNNYD